jgi:hypothetical protein
MLRLSPFQRWAPALLAFLAPACNEDTQPTAPSPEARATFEVSDAPNGGNPHFYFLPPLAPAPKAEGTFDPTLAPTVRICVLPTCLSDLVTLSTGADQGEIKVGGQAYHVTWRSETPLASGGQYRVRVYVGTLLLGFVDLQVVAPGTRTPVPQGFVAIRPGRPVQIKFRIEEGALDFGTPGVTQWSLIPFDPAMNGGRDLWADPSGDLFVVGADLTEPETGPGTSLWHYDGQEWHGVNAVAKNFLGVWGSSASDVYAAACNVDQGGDGGIWHFDGSGWSDVTPVPPPQTLTCYKAVWGSSASDVFVGGDRLSLATGGAPALIAHFDGASWTAAGVPGRTIDGLSGTGPNDVYALSTEELCDDCNQSRALLLHYDGTSWTKAASFDGVVFRGIWVNATNDVWIAGADFGQGTIFHYDGTRISETYFIPPDFDSDILDIWGSSGSDIYAVGFRGILHYDGSAWAPVNPTPSGDVWGIAAANVYALVAGGVLHGTP